MNIANLNRIFTTKGPAAALATATAAQMDGWIIGLLRDGKWDPNRKAAVAKSAPREFRTVVDRNGDKRLLKVMIGTEFLGYQIETMGESGNVVSVEGLGKLSLNEARLAIGKSITHPVPANHGTSTNVIRPRHDGKKKKD